MATERSLKQAQALVALGYCFDTTTVAFQNAIAEALDAARAEEREASDEMLLEGARSIGKSIHQENHIERARQCWSAMIRARAKEAGDG